MGTLDDVKQRNTILKFFLHFFYRNIVTNLTDGPCDLFIVNQNDRKIIKSNQK